VHSIRKGPPRRVAGNDQGVVLPGLHTRGRPPLDAPHIPSNPRLPHSHPSLERRRPRRFAQSVCYPGHKRTLRRAPSPALFGTDHSLTRTLSLRPLPRIAPLRAHRPTSPRLLLLLCAPRPPSCPHSLPLSRFCLWTRGSQACWCVPLPSVTLALHEAARPPRLRAASRCPHKGTAPRVSHGVCVAWAATAWR